jgi:hypothetical protein
LRIADCGLKGALSFLDHTFGNRRQFACGVSGDPSPLRIADCGLKSAFRSSRSAFGDHGVGPFLETAGRRRIYYFLKEQVFGARARSVADRLASRRRVLKSAIRNPKSAILS